MGIVKTGSTFRVGHVLFQEPLHCLLAQLEPEVCRGCLVAGALLGSQPGCFTERYKDHI